ncbi:MAG TPA: methyltransferase domain-containing protein [Candidatus Sulfopaludibacter sp.]|jgi:SAM-dependent methyltransferase|nr:methyltransferase domain-containing protein [Candidatus Sulfopaludibacter sp.]
MSTFTCNVCGRSNPLPAAPPEPETPNCRHCGSNVRTRGLVHLLTEELLGTSLPLTDLPRVPSLRGLGTSDSETYAEQLAGRFDYRNTYFHREPRFDIARAGSDEFGKYDFLVSSEVLEHVLSPVEAAFENACRMLKPSGVFVFTVPYSLEATTTERFSQLHDFGFARLSDRTLLVNRTNAGEVQVFNDLIFHGGGGSTLEMREFSESALKTILAGAGFTSVRIDSDDHPEFGILRKYSWSLPIAARKGPFALSRDAARDLVEQHEIVRKRLQGILRSLAVRVACKLRLF